MKKIFCFISIALLLCSCDRNPYKTKTYSWEKFPMERFESYFPYSKGETIKFASEMFDTIQIDFDRVAIENIFQICQEKFKKNNFGEDVRAEFIDAVNQDPTQYKFRLAGHFINRHYIYFVAEIGYGLNVGVSFQQELPFDENYMPFDENEIFKFMTDTIILKNHTTNNTAFLVSGKGLVSFIDNDGVEWVKF